MTSVEVIHCHPHPHIGETLAANYLRHHLPGGSVLLVNYYLPYPPGTLEIDLVVINRNGVYLLEVKHWAGAIEADQVHWRHSSGDRRDSPIVSIEHKARVMHGFLQRQGWGHVSVVGLVVLSKGTGAFHSTDPSAHKVFGLHETLIEALTGRQYVFHHDSPTLASREVHCLRNVVLDNHVADAERRVAGYRILSEKERGHYVELEAEDPEFPGRQVRIKQYDVPTVGSQKELEEAVARFKRDMAALIQAGSHPNLVMPLEKRGGGAGALPPAAGYSPQPLSGEHLSGRRRTGQGGRLGLCPGADDQPHASPNGGAAGRRSARVTGAGLSRPRRGRPGRRLLSGCRVVRHAVSPRGG
jgi:hypothetical protein